MRKVQMLCMMQNSIVIYLYYEINFISITILNLYIIKCKNYKFNTYKFQYLISAINSQK